MARTIRRGSSGLIGHTCRQQVITQGEFMKVLAVRGEPAPPPDFLVGATFWRCSDCSQVGLWSGWLL